MTILLNLLAQSDSPEKFAGVGENPLTGFNVAIRQHPDLLGQPDALAPILSDMPLVWAMVFVVIGALCVIYGYRSHKLVITVIAGLMGVWLGLSSGEHLGDATITAVSAAVLFAVLAWPLLKFSVAIFGGLCGAFAGANLFTLIFNAAERANYQIPAELEHVRDTPYIGAFVGLVVMSMLAFIAFRSVVILFTSVLGASLLVSGVLGMLMYNDSWTASISAGMSEKPLITPLVVTVIATIGAAVQLSGGVKGLAVMANKADPKAPQPKKA